MKKFAALMGVLLILCSASLAAANPLPPVPADKRIVLLVDEWKAVRNLPVVIAERLGLLRADGFDVTVMNVRDDVWHGDMLMDGRIDAVMAYWHHNAVNQSIGRDTQVIVTMGVTPGAKVLVANKSRDKFKTPADLKGARFIAGGDGSSKTTIANALVLAGGHKLADYTRLGTDGKELNVAALREGRADFVVAPTPDASYYEAQGVATVWADLTTLEGTKKAFGTAFPTTTVFMATERIKQRPEVARHLATAFVRALMFINTHSAEEVAAIVPPEVIRKDRAKYMAALKEALPMFANDGRMPADGVAGELRVLAEFDAKYRTVAVERTYTNAFAEEALKAMP
jgi:NitT/TauT family transport system substrate-binding protein